MDERLLRVKMVIMDVDGVLTDGSMIFNADGTESKTFNVRDGSGIKYLMRSGIETALLSARECAAVRRRAESLGISHCITGALDKLPAYRSLLEKAGLSDADVCYVGDDLTDIPPMRAAGFPVAVADAAREVKHAAAYVTETRGGRGAVREVAEMILQAQGKWEGVMERYLA
ncbi:MAG: HAD-IIIA family hydrolase [Planctomycetota bacterium]